MRRWKWSQLPARRTLTGSGRCEGCPVRPTLRGTAWTADGICGGDDPAAVVRADLFDQHPDRLNRPLGSAAGRGGRGRRPGSRRLRGAPFEGVGVPVELRLQPRDDGLASRRVALRSAVARSPCARRRRRPRSRRRGRRGRGRGAGSGRRLRVGPWGTVALAPGGAVLVAGGAGVVGAAAAASMHTRADIGATAVVAAHEPGQEVARVLRRERCVFAPAPEDRLSGLERVLVDERVVQAGVELAVPADESAVVRRRRGS
jgi:hypothetical protein